MHLLTHTTQQHTPCNKGKLTGQKPPFKLKEIRSLTPGQDDGRTSTYNQVYRLKKCSTTQAKRKKRILTQRFGSAFPASPGTGYYTFFCATENNASRPDSIKKRGAGKGTLAILSNLTDVSLCPILSNRCRVRVRPACHVDTPPNSVS